MPGVVPDSSPNPAAHPCRPASQPRDPRTFESPSLGESLAGSAPGQGKETHSTEPLPRPGSLEPRRGSSNPGSCAARPLLDRNNRTKALLTRRRLWYPLPTCSAAGGEVPIMPIEGTPPQRAGRRCSRRPRVARLSPGRRRRRRTPPWATGSPVIPPGRPCRHGFSQGSKPDRKSSPAGARSLRRVLAQPRPARGGEVLVRRGEDTLPRRGSLGWGDDRIIARSR